LQNPVPNHVNSLSSLIEWLAHVGIPFITIPYDRESSIP
jgi:hypothetical protein